MSYDSDAFEILRPFESSSVCQWSSEDLRQALNGDLPRKFPVDSVFPRAITNGEVCFHNTPNF